MSATVVVQPAAQRDLADIANYLAERSLRTSLRFTEAVATCLSQFAALPELGGHVELANPRLAGIRAWRVRGFKKYVIFYQSREDEVTVLRILHASRDIESALGT